MVGRWLIPLKEGSVAGGSVAHCELQNPYFGKVRVTWLVFFRSLLEPYLIPITPSLNPYGTLSTTYYPLIKPLLSIQSLFKDFLGIN